MLLAVKLIGLSYPSPQIEKAIEEMKHKDSKQKMSHALITARDTWQELIKNYPGWAGEYLRSLAAKPTEKIANR
jgi:hypothetical protein